MGLMTQKDMAQKGAGQINAFLEESKLNKAQAKKDEEARIFAQNHPDPTKEEEGLVDPLAMFTPLASDVVDVDRAIGSALEGDWGGAALGMVAAVPIVGDAAKAAIKASKKPNKVDAPVNLQKTISEYDATWDKFEEIDDVAEWQATVRKHVSEKRVDNPDVKTPELEESARQLSELKITREEHLANVDKYKPVREWTAVPREPSNKTIVFSLNDGQRTKGSFVFGSATAKSLGVQKSALSIGDNFNGRLDITAYKAYDTWVVAGTSKGLGGTHYAKAIHYKGTDGGPVKFIASQKTGERIGKGEKPKTPYATVSGVIKDLDPDAIRKKADELLNDPEWTQVGFDPRRQGAFYVRGGEDAGVAVVEADEVIQVGALLLARKAVLDPTKTNFNKGGLVDAEMATLNFSHGGTVHGKVGASNVGADMLAKLISQNKQGDFKRRDAREDAREVMQAPQSTPVDDRPALDAAVIKMVQDHKRKQVVQAEEVPQSPQYSFDASLSSAADQAVDKLSVAVPSLGAIGESLLESGIDAGTDLASNVGDFLVGTYQDYKQRDLNTRTRLGSTYDDEMAGMDLVNKEVEKKEVEKVKPTTTFEADGFEHTLAAEGDKHHVDGGGVLTMSYGIVPDINSISLNGDPINPRTGHTFKVGSDLSKIDFSNATKTVRDVVIKRGDYTTDKEFANAVYTTMATKTKSNLESNKGFKSKWADLPREAKIALVDLDFNTGVGKATPTTEEEKGGSHWSDTALMATEMVKPLEDRSTANLIKFTQNFLDNGESPRGLLRRRLNAYNLVSKVEDKAVYTKQHKEVVADGVYKGKYRHDVFRADGTIIVSWYKVKSPATKADESVQRVVDGELFNELPVSPKPKQAAVDKTDWNRMIS